MAPNEWTRAARCTEGGMNCVEVKQLDDGSRLIRDSKRPGVMVGPFTPAEFEAFQVGVRSGDFA